MIDLIVDKTNKQVIKITDYEKFEHKLESLGSHSNCNFFYMSSLNENDYSEMEYLLMSSGEAPYSNFELVEID